MSKEIVLEVDNLSKRYKIYPSSWGRIKEWLTWGRRTYHTDYWALKDVNFKLYKGEFIGVIGPNGAGKSTLLKVITGALDASGGSYKTTGRVLSLLELSGGLDENLTGRENIIRTLRLLGFPEEYAKERMTDIMEFAELGEFFDRPMETYSSGMRIRLAFSMFTFLDCDVLILDEVLAVGDIFFKQKCYARLEQLIKKSTSIILVTQSTSVVAHYCNSVIVMNKGEMIFHGAADAAIQMYFELRNRENRAKSRVTYVEEDYVSIPGISFTNSPVKFHWPSEKLFDGSPPPETPEQAFAILSHLLVCDESGRPKQVFAQGEVAVFYYAFLARQNMGIPIVELNISTINNIHIHGRNSIQQTQYVDVRPLRGGGYVRVMQSVKIDLFPGNYIFDLGLSSLHPSDYGIIHLMSPQELKEKRKGIVRIKQAGAIMVVARGNNQTVSKHNGLCNLEGNLFVTVEDGTLSGE